MFNDHIELYIRVYDDICYSSMGNKNKRLSCKNITRATLGYTKSQMDTQF